MEKRNFQFNILVKNLTVAQNILLFVVLIFSVTRLTACTPTLQYSLQNSPTINSSSTSSSPTPSATPSSGPTLYVVIASGDSHETISPSTVQTVQSGSTLSYIVTPSTNYTNVIKPGGTCSAGSWSGTTYTTGLITASCTVTFAAALTVYTVTPSGDGSESISPSAVQNVSSGATSSFTITANTNFVTSTSVGGTCPTGSWSGVVYTTGPITSSPGNCTVTFSAQCSPCKMFQTASSYTGNLGGITGASGADAKCKSDANYPGTGTYKAMIADGVVRTACTTSNCGGGTSEHLNWVLYSNTTYTRTDGVTTIGTTNSAGIFTFALTNSISTSGFDVWSSLNTDWTTWSGYNCTGWSTTTGVGGLGTAAATTSAAINNTFGTSCGSSLYFFCAQQ